MAKYFEITDRDGRKRIVDSDDDFVVPDGSSVRVPLMMRDSVLSPMQRAIADAATFDADKAMRDFATLCQRSHEIKERAYLDAKAELSEAWRTPVADRRRWRRVIERDPEGRERGSQGWEEEDAVSGGQKAGDVCTINGAPGHLNAQGQCVPDRQDARPVYDHAEGLRIKDAAWREMVAEMEGAWRTR